jgi:hypothetical protein
MSRIAHGRAIPSSSLEVTRPQSASSMRPPSSTRPQSAGGQRAVRPLSAQPATRAPIASHAGGISVADDANRHTSQKNGGGWEEGGRDRGGGGGEGGSRRPQSASTRRPTSPTSQPYPGGVPVSGGLGAVHDATVRVRGGGGGRMRPQSANARTQNGPYGKGSTDGIGRGGGGGEGGGSISSSMGGRGVGGGEGAGGAASSGISKRMVTDLINKVFERFDGDGKGCITWVDAKAAVALLTSRVFPASELQSLREKIRGLPLPRCFSPTRSLPSFSFPDNFLQTPDDSCPIHLHQAMSPTKATVEKSPSPRKNSMPWVSNQSTRRPWMHTGARKCATRPHSHQPCLRQKQRGIFCQGQAGSRSLRSMSLPTT